MAPDPPTPRWRKPGRPKSWTVVCTAGLRMLIIDFFRDSQNALYRQATGAPRDRGRDRTTAVKFDRLIATRRATPMDRRRSAHRRLRLTLRARPTAVPGDAALRAACPCLRDRQTPAQIRGNTPCTARR